MNITDIGHLTGDSDDGEDKMLKTAQEKGKTVLEIAAYYTEAFFKDIDALNIATDGNLQGNRPYSRNDCAHRTPRKWSYLHGRW